MAGRAATLTIQVLADTAKASAALSGTGNQAGGLAGKFNMSGAAALGFAGAAVAAGAAIIGMTQAAADDAAEHARLEQAFIAAGAATGDWKATVDAAIVAGQDLAFTDTQIRDALVPLIAATGDADKAAQDLALAQDIARLKGIDLETAANAVAKAEAGSATQLAKLIGVQAKGKTAAEVLALAQEKSAGQAEVYGATTAGQAESMSIAFDELTEMIGGFFLPILAEILPVLKPILNEFGKLITALLPVLIPLVKLLIIPLKILVKVLGFVFEMLAKVVNWLSKAVDAVGDFLGSLGPVSGIVGGLGDFFGGLSAGTQGIAMAQQAAGPAARAGGSNPFGTCISCWPGVKVSGKVTVTHRIEDPGGVLSNIPGGASAVARELARGTDALGLYRNLQHAAGLR